MKVTRIYGMLDFGGHMAVVFEREDGWERTVELTKKQVDQAIAKIIELAKENIEVQKS